MEKQDFWIYVYIYFFLLTKATRVNSVHINMINMQ